MFKNQNAQCYRIICGVELIRLNDEYMPHFFKRQIDDFIGKEELKVLSVTQIKMMSNTAYAEFTDVEKAETLYKEMKAKNIPVTKNYVLED